MGLLRLPGNKKISLVLAVHILVLHLYSQRVETGNYADFDFGPHGVYGTFKLSRTRYRAYFEIVKINDSVIIAKRFNESGVVGSTFNITFFKGLLSHVELIDQWGEVFNRMKFLPQGNDVFRVTQFRRGENYFLPGKYALFTYTNEVLTEESYHLSDGTLKDNHYGFATVRYKRYVDKNRFASQMEAAYFDSKGAPVISTLKGYHRVVNEFDDNDDLLSESFFGLNDEPLAVRGGSAAGGKYTYDDNGHDLTAQFLGLNGQVALNENGVGGMKREYVDGLKVKETRYDSLHNIARSAATGDGIAIIRYQYDKSGNQVKESFFDELDSPINNHLGFHSQAGTYSPDNMLLKTSFLNQKDAPGKNRDGISYINYVKDEFNRTIQESWFDTAGVRVKNYIDRVYMVKSNYDGEGRKVSTSYWEDSLTPMPRWNGIYEDQTKYNEDGLDTENSYHNQIGQLMKSSDGWSVGKLTYDQNSNLIKREFLFDDELIERTRGATHGYAVIRYEYDSIGRVSQILFYGKDHEAVDATIYITEKIQAHRVEFKYKWKRIVEQWYYKANIDTPFLKLDCLKNDFLNVSGLGVGRKNQN